MGPIGCPEPSVQNYHSTLRNIPEERRSLLHDGGSLISSMNRAVPSLPYIALWLTKGQVDLYLEIDAECFSYLMSFHAA